jgi:isopentenyl diphosphate isomerase/L-lactate dehydrogenase-like FMN-dependent dehydrogenase
MSNFILIITIITGVLQIVLFFKVWVMTNDVRKIREKMDADLEIDRIDKIRIALLKGDKQKAIELLTDKLATELVKKSSEDNISPEYIQKLKENYAKEFAKLGVDELPIKDVYTQKEINGLMRRF